MDDNDIPGARLAGDLDLLPVEELSVSLRDFVSFLASCGRSTKCPVCTHTGEWLVHAHDEDGRQVMNIYGIPYAGRPKEIYPVFNMECPQCGFISSTSALKVKEFVEAAKDE